MKSETRLTEWSLDMLNVRRLGPSVILVASSIALAPVIEAQQQVELTVNVEDASIENSLRGIFARATDRAKVTLNVSDTRTRHGS